VANTASLGDSAETGGDPVRENEKKGRCSLGLLRHYIISSLLSVKVRLPKVSGTGFFVCNNLEGEKGG